MEFSTEWIKDEICKAIADKKGKDIAVIDVANLTIVADYFIIASGKSTTQVKGIANNIDEALSKQGLEPLRREGIPEGRWAAIDYGNVIAHIFNEETREIYCLDKLWSDGKNTVKYEYKE